MRFVRVHDRVRRRLQGACIQRASSARFARPRLPFVDPLPQRRSALSHRGKREEGVRL